MPLVKFKVENCGGRSALMAYDSSEKEKTGNYARDFLILPCYEFEAST
jgi:hypothetical protein